MNYQKEYAVLVGQVDRVISILEQFPFDNPIVQKASSILTSVLREAEDHYISQEEED